MQQMLKHNRRYSELDWLRVLLIFAVFLHHVFMPFNGDGWHVMNNESSKVLDDIMVYFEQLRLQTLCSQLFVTAKNACSAISIE